VGDTDGIDGSMDKTIRDANALFDGSSPDLNKQIGLGVTSHNNAVAAVFVGIALVALPAVAIPGWLIAGAATVAIAAIVANSTIDWGQIGNLLGGSNDRKVKELEDLESHTHFNESDQPNAPDTDGDGKPNVEKNPDGTPKITGHATDRLGERGVTPEGVADAIDNPISVEIGPTTEKGRSTRYVGKDATVVINPDTGKIISVWKTGSRKRK
jgi:hypothetical protein